MYDKELSVAIRVAIRASTSAEEAYDSMCFVQAEKILVSQRELLYLTLSAVEESMTSDINHDMVMETRDLECLIQNAKAAVKARDDNRAHRLEDSVYDDGAVG